jgi:hypothetical protein
MSKYEVAIDESEPEKVEPAVCTLVTSAKTVDSAPLGHMEAMSTSMGMAIMKLTTWMTTSSPMANLGRVRVRG